MIADFVGNGANKRDTHLMNHVISEDIRAQVKAQLRKAYALIKSGQKAEAYELLTPIVAQHPDNVDAWWLVAHAALTPRESAFACQKVLALRPDHRAAPRMLAEQQRLMAAEQHIELKRVRRQRRGLRPWAVLAFIALPLLLLGMFMVAVNTTGNNFGLPIGPLFNIDEQLGSLPVNQAGERQQAESMVYTLRTGTLVIGSTHDYTFTVSQRGVWAFISIRFSFLGDTPPGKAVQLLNANGKLVSLTTGELTLGGLGDTGGIVTLLPGQGKYTLRLLGTAGTAQGPYVLQFALSKLE